LYSDLIGVLTAAVVVFIPRPRNISDNRNMKNLYE